MTGNPAGNKLMIVEVDTVRASTVFANGHSADAPGVRSSPFGSVQIRLTVQSSRKVKRSITTRGKHTKTNYYVNLREGFRVNTEAPAVSLPGRSP